MISYERVLQVLGPETVGHERETRFEMLRVLRWHVENDQTCEAIKERFGSY